MTSEKRLRTTKRVFSIDQGKVKLKKQHYAIDGEQLQRQQWQDRMARPPQAGAIMTGASQHCGSVALTSAARRATCWYAGYY
jgi:hypothetical protein